MRADRLLLLLALVAAFAFAVAPARATTISFECLTDNDPGDCAIGESQFSVDVTDQGGGIVRFHFKNAGPEASVLSEVYFDDGSLLTLSSVIDGPGVDFEPDASPPNLPGGENAVPPFEVTEGFLAESVPSPAVNGAGPTEWVAIEFTLQGGQTFADVISEFTTGELRIGIHVIGFASGGSESFINPPIPEPSTALLLGGGLVGVGLLRRGRGARRAIR
jgi:hypothetical protein